MEELLDTARPGWFDLFYEIHGPFSAVLNFFTLGLVVFVDATSKSYRFILASIQV